MWVASLDRWVFHLAAHPYYNQLWGMLTLPFSIVLAWAWVRDRSRRTLALLVLFTAMGGFAYPLMLPFPLLALAGFLYMDHRERLVRGEASSLDPRRLWRGGKSLLWMVPVAIALAVPIRGVAEKFAEAVSALAHPSTALISWQGDLPYYPPIGEFFALPAVPAPPLIVAALVVFAFLGLRRLPRALGMPLIVVLGLALAWAMYFHQVKYGQYFYFKILSFSAPLILAAAVAALSRMRVGAIATAALCVAALFSARDEINRSYDQLTPEIIELREWSRALPQGASVRLDTPPSPQLWQAYFLAERPVGAGNPITDYPHVPFTKGADYALDETLRPPPPDAVGPPVRRNSALRLWRLRPGAGPDTTSRRQVQIVSGVTLAN
jgi:hypothetical protein